MKSIIYDGLRFTRDDETGYYLSSKSFNGRQKRLHVYVWEKHNGPVPKGYDVHHKDKDKDNNDPSNLELLTKAKHQSSHWKSKTDEEKAQYRERLLKNATPKAAEWHRSEEGRAWHSEHGKAVAKNMEEREYVCENCGRRFYKKPFGANKFCSNACRAADRRKSGVDNEIRKCVVCGEPFEVDKYKATKTCSRSCANRLRAGRV